jgi:hypothetical protein
MQIKMSCYKTQIDIKHTFRDFENIEISSCHDVM